MTRRYERTRARHGSTSLLRAVLCLLAVLGALLPGLAAAHPLGNFTINRFSRIEPGPERIALHFVVDMAEIPAFQELSRLGASDGALEPDAAARYARQRADELREKLLLTADGTPLPLLVRSAALALPEGQGGLRTLRLEVEYEAAARPGLIAYRDDSYGDRLGWKEVVVRPTDDAAVEGADVPAASSSDELRAYPESMLQAPLNRTSAHFRVPPAFGATAATAPSFHTAPEGVGPTAPASIDGEALVGLTRILGRIGLAPSLGQASETIGALARVELTLPLLAAALAAAAGFGALHALSPGHGKTVVAAYLVGTRGTARHALALGLTVTATHTWGVFALGLATVYAGQLVPAERLYPWLGLISGLLVVAMGLSLVRARLRGSDEHRHEHDHHHHEHGHDHQHEHSHYGVHWHSHVPAEGVGWRGLIALGVVGGLLPCPSALILMLGSIALGRTALGLGLVLAFSLGLAAVLVVVGLLFVYARELLERVGRRRAGAGLPSPVRLAVRLVPVGSAIAVALAGVAISASALPGVLGG